ncbi:AAA domain-containing protein [Speluncibacter jeojiensis]|uniref:AAA domain-containing protein n=1 Tax=Speluncibacter jeojiensis TaxID=2710754 RepID=UPI00240FD8C2|nr:AAA domain-containing protein [Rhodococcus sp. D2-41]
MNREDDPHLKDRVQRLMRFLRELVKSRSKPVLDHRRHEDVVWLSEDAVEVALVRDAAAGDVVLRSRRVMLSDPPALPAHLHGRVRGDVTDSTATPTLDPQVTDIGTAFDDWLADWQAWAATDRERRPVWQLNTALQRAMQELGARPESVELVLAAGLLTLPSTDVGEPARTHILTQPATIERDDASGDLLVRLASETAPRLEDTQLLTGLSMFDPTGSRALQDGLQGLSSPIDMAIPVFLKAWAGRSLTVPVQVEGESDIPDTDRTLVAAPALVLRKRGAFALVEYYDRMITEAERDDVPVPLGLAQLVEAIEPDDRVDWLDRAGSAPSATLAEDPLFPLPANPEQREIIARLARDSGVVVEGPPGTGKTHTIANLVSALLAQGQRVLVTSEKAQALRVLRDKLPPEMQELCVAITDVGRGGSAELNRSVAEIATRKSSYNAATTNARIDDLTARRTESLSRRSSITERIRSLRESETFVHPEVASGYAGTAASIVRHVTRCADRYGWLPGPLHSAEPGIGGAQVPAMLDLTARSTPERAQRLQQALPRIDGVLPSPGDLHQLCARAGAAPQDVQPEAAWLMEALAVAPQHVLTDVRLRCERLHGVVVDIRRQSAAFQAAADAVLSGAAEHLWSKTSDLPGLLQLATQSDSFVGPRTVDVPVAGRHALDAYGAMASAMHGGLEWRGRFRKSDQQKAVEALGPVATVDGQPATTAELMRVVAEHLRALDCVHRAAAVLADLRVPLDTAGTRAVQVNDLANVERSRQVVNALVEQSSSIADALRSIHPGVPPVRSIAEASALAAAAAAIAARSDTDAARTALQSLAESVAACFSSAPSPEGAALVDAIGAGDYAGVESALSALEDARAVQAEEELLAGLRRQLEDSGPGLAALVAESPSDERWFARVAELDEAWAWRRAQQWVQAHHEEGVDRRLESDLEIVEADIARLTAQLAAERAWRGCLERMTAEQVQALQAYRGQVANIGKGTGKYAEQYRSAARSAMQVAQGAVPAWVMPLQQVLASIPAEPGAFDVVIVDEASQADIASLFLLWLAPRVIVVGDDKQCAPSEVASGALDAVFQRLDTYLPDMPEYLRASLTPRDSLFSMLRTRFGQVVRLREHFRCMPEIISWSSNQFYRDAPLVPLRQFGSDRLKPLRTSYVDGGVVTGRDAKLSNRPEALAIADAIEACLDDPAYDGKTFGVVVLQGQAQVDVIRNELLDRLDGKQWDERRLRIGTPPDFQGDERHVVFLSMVIAPGQRVAARTDNKAQRAFNVAASRAQDQLWLFHSVTSDSLRDTDLRHSLLTYMQATSPAPADPMPAGVTRDDRHALFDSLFEQRVFLDITARGYHVNPQVEVNSRRIDLVVTGAAGRLAVECDGDAFHTTPEQRARDLERERELKRCGWEFWRIRESAYYLDPVGALSGLWAELDRRGIAPVILDESGPSEGSAWTPVVLVDDESHTDLPDDAAPELPVVEASPTVDSAPTASDSMAGVGTTLAEPTVVLEESVPAASPSIDVVPAMSEASTVAESLALFGEFAAGTPLSLFKEFDADEQPSLFDEYQVNEPALPTEPVTVLVDETRGAPGIDEPTDGAVVTSASAWEIVDPDVVPVPPPTPTVPSPLDPPTALDTPITPTRTADGGIGPSPTAEAAHDSVASEPGLGSAWEIMPRSEIPTGDTKQPEREDVLDLSPRLLQQFIVAEAKQGPVTVDVLARNLRVAASDVHDAADGLVGTGSLIRVGESFLLPEDVAAGSEQTPQDEVACEPEAMPHISPEPSPHLSARHAPHPAPEPKPAADPPSVTDTLPAAQGPSAKRVLQAASWRGPVTLARAVQITRLAEAELEPILAELERESVLRRENGADGVTWVRR